MDIINDSLNQYYWHIQYLQNKETSLWYHGYNNVHKDHMSGFYWGRANAWAAYTMSQVKKNLYDWYLFPPCMDVECSLRDQLAALKLVQTENGLWRTILDDEESYEEVSASAGIAAAMVEMNNPLHAKYVQKALKGILDNVEPKSDFAYYKKYRRVIHFLSEYSISHEHLLQMWNNINTATVLIIGLGAVGT